MTFSTVLTSATHVPFDTRNSTIAETYVLDEKSNGYLNALRTTDDLIRDIWSMYQNKGLENNTLLVIMGDHGLSIRDHDHHLVDTLGRSHHVLRLQHRVTLNPR